MLHTTHQDRWIIFGKCIVQVLGSISRHVVIHLRLILDLLAINDDDVNEFSFIILTPVQYTYTTMIIDYFTNYILGPRTSSIQTALLFLALFLHFHLFPSGSQFALRPPCGTGNPLVMAASLSHGGKALQQPYLRSNHGG